MVQFYGKPLTKIYEIFVNKALNIMFDGKIPKMELRIHFCAECPPTCGTDDPWGCYLFRTIRSNKIATIYIKKQAMDAELRTLAHELGHVWQDFTGEAKAINKNGKITWIYRGRKYKTAPKWMETQADKWEAYLWHQWINN